MISLLNLFYCIILWDYYWIFLSHNIFRIFFPGEISFDPGRTAHYQRTIRYHSILGNQASFTYNTVLCQADPERFARPQLMSITKFLSGKRQLLLFYNKNDHIGFQNFRNPFSGRYQKQHPNDNKVIIRICFLTVYHLFASIHIFLNPPFH